MSNIEATYVGHLLGETRDEVRAVHEGVAGTRKVVNNQPTWNDFNELKSEVETFKMALTTTNRNVADLDRRVTWLRRLR